MQSLILRRAWPPSCLGMSDGGKYVLTFHDVNTICHRCPALTTFPKLIKLYWRHQYAQQIYCDAIINICRLRAAILGDVDYSNNHLRAPSLTASANKETAASFCVVRNQFQDRIHLI